LIRDSSNGLKCEKRRIEQVFLGPKLGYNNVEDLCSQNKRRKIEKLVDSMGQRPGSGTSSIKEDGLEAVIGVQHRHLIKRMIQDKHVCQQMQL
jgi:hypothetical protein